MKRKVCAVILIITMILSLMACGKSGSEESAKKADSTANTIRIGMITDVGGVYDGSFNQTSWEGLKKASEELGFEAKYLESKTDADYTTNIATFVDEDYDLIICAGNMLANALRESAEENTEQKYAIIDDASCSDLDNVTCLMFEQCQASYLAGIVAAMMTETNKVGLILGMSNESMHEFGYGYLAGVLDTNSDVAITQYNANTFSDAAIGKSAAVTMVTGGVDVIFQAAGATGLGVIEGCKENGIWDIGVDTDQSKLAPENILTSAMKRVDTACYSISQACLEGTLTGGVITYDIASGGVDLAPTTDNLTDEVILAVSGAKAKIIDGEIDVPKTKAEFEAKYGDAYELD